MSLLIAGNLANTGFYLVSKLRENKINADLLMEINPPFESDPKNSGLLSNREYPNWIRFFDKMKNWKFDVIKIMRQYDLVIAATEFPILSLFSFRPFIAIATGSDLYELAQSNTLKGFLLRLSYSKARIVVFTLPSQKEYVKKIRLKNYVFLPLFRKDKINVPEISDAAKNDRFVFFHPTNHFWSFKRNDIFLKAYVKLARTRNDVFLITVNRGPDAHKSIEFLKSSGIEGKYEILPRTLDQSELQHYYSHSDVVVDQFGIGSFGLIGLEALCIGKPLICYIEEDSYEELYGEKPPVISSNDESEVYSFLEKLVNDKNFYNDIVNRSLRWYQKYHAENVLLKKYIKLYELVHNGISSQDIRKQMEISF